MSNIFSLFSCISWFSLYLFCFPLICIVFSLFVMLSCILIVFHVFVVLSDRLVFFLFVCVFSHVSLYVVLHFWCFACIFCVGILITYRNFEKVNESLKRTDAPLLFVIAFEILKRLIGHHAKLRISPDWEIAPNRKIRNWASVDPNRQIAIRQITAGILIMPDYCQITDYSDRVE